MNTRRFPPPCFLQPNYARRLPGAEYSFEILDLSSPIILPRLRGNDQTPLSFCYEIPGITKAKTP